MSEYIYSTAQIRQAEQQAFASGTVASLTLMERAGAAVFSQLRQRWPHAQQILVLCGSGNNGGDGYVVARLAQEAGLQVALRAVAAPRTPDSQIVAERALAAGVDCQPWAGEQPIADVIVDALLGTGLRSALADPYAQVVQQVNASLRPVLAIDVPSGLDADTGNIMGCAIQAELTVTFIGHKLGLLTGEGASLVGELLLRPLRLPIDFYPQPSLATCLQEADLQLPRRARNSHKGHFGHVLVVGGDEGMGGAALMAAEAALHAGAGRVSVATHPAHVSAVLARAPEVMVRGLMNAADLLPMLAAADVVVVGPGLGRGDWGRQVWQQVQAQMPRQQVVDADGLYWLAQQPDQQQGRILTPHPGEAATLLGIGTAAVQANRLQAVQTLRTTYGGVMVLKGAGSLLASSTGISLCPYGNPGMSAAGMGDILAGLMGGLVAQFGVSQRTAEWAVLAHALAGDRAALAGERGLRATDLLHYLRELLNP